ncbi:MAG: HlyD family secretion protein [Verrucomicrobia bacterium]|nr:HlyD family secretion protein [Verrucomicrobiota bacterium]
MDTTIDSPAPVATTDAPARSTPWKAIFGGVVALALLAWFGHMAVHAYHYEETEDAYITGHLHQISPQLDGQVKEILVADNQTVHAGDVLVRLDPLEFQLAADKARAALDQAKAQVTATRAAAAQADAAIAEAEARVKQAEAQTAQTTAQLDLARLTLARNEELFSKGGVITQADLDNVRSAYRAADAAQSASQANVTAARSAIGSAQAARNSAQAQVTAALANAAVAESAVRNADRQLGYTTITAPADGRIGNKAVELGNRVVAGQTLFSLAAPEAWVVANFKETQLARMHAGQPVELTIDAVPGHPLHGTIESIAPASGAQFALLPPDNATGNFNKVVQRVPVKIVLDDASRRDLGDRLRLGLSAIVNVRIR